MTTTHSGGDIIGAHTLQVIAKADHFNEWLYEQIRPELHGKIIEIGSGIGNISQFLVRDGYDISLSDLDEGYLEALVKKFGQNPRVERILPIDLVAADFTSRYALLEGRYETVFLLNVLEHIEDDHRAISNTHFLLKPGGQVIVLTPAYPWLYCRYDKELGHFRRYTRHHLSAVVRAGGFQPVHARYFNFLGIPGWLLLGKILRHKNLEAGEVSLFNKLVPLGRWLDKLVFRRMGLSVIVTGKK